MKVSIIFWWLIRSSEDPKKASKTILGIGVGVLAFLPTIGALMGVSIDTTAWSDLFKNLANFVEIFLLGVSAWMTVTGAVRKVSTTVFGTNKVLKDPLWK